MLKINLMQILASLSLCLLFTVHSDAQVKIWGVGAAVGQTDAEFANPFVNSGVATPLNDTAWTALSISEGVSSAGAGGTFPGDSYWVRNLTGTSQGAYGMNQPVVSSPSMANGVALFDSDFLDNAGVAGAFGTGVAPAYQTAELISPKIDLSGYSNEPLIVKFYSRWRAFLVNEYFISMSVDGGTTWTDVDINTIQPQATNADPDEGWVQAPFYNITSGVANLTDCRIKFRFNGRYYYNIVDDVSVESVSGPDIAISKPDPNSNNLGGAFTDVKIGNNRQIPTINIDSTDLKEWFWGMQLENSGPYDILPPVEYRARVVIDFVDALSGLTTTGVYLDTIAVVDSLLAGSANDTILVKSLRDLSFINTYGEGTYSVKYWVEFDGSDTADINSANDTTFHEFIITGPASPNPNYLSKCGIRAQDGKVRYTRPVIPSGGPFQAYEYGSMFYFPRGMTDTLRIDSVDFRYYVSSGYTGVASHDLAINVYHFVDGSGNSAANGTMDADGSELTNVGTGIVNCPAGTVQTYYLATVNQLFDPGSGGPMASLVDNGFYLVSIYENPSVLTVGGQATFDSDNGLWFGAQEINYSLNTGLTSVADFIPHAAPVKIIDAAGIGDWNWVGFGADIEPSIALYLNKGAAVVTGNNTVWETEGAELNLFPNPTTDVLNVDVKFDNASDVMYILTDMSGRVISIMNSTNVTQETKSINVSSLASGVYMLTAKTAEGSSTERFVKQ